MLGVWGRKQLGKVVSSFRGENREIRNSPYYIFLFSPPVQLADEKDLGRPPHGPQKKCRR